MTDVALELGTLAMRIDAECQVAFDGTPDHGELPFTEYVSSYDIGDYVILDGIPVADSDGGVIATTGGVDSSTVVTTPLDRATLFPEAYAHWIGGTAYMSLDYGTLYRWWPVGSTRTDTDARLSFFLGQDAGSGGLQYAAEGKHRGFLPPYQDNAYTYQGYGRAMNAPAAVFPGGGYAKIDPEANFASATLAITAIFHPSDLAYFGIFEAAQYAHDDSEVVIGDPMVLRWHHGQLRLYHADELVLAHESHRQSAAPVTIMVSLDADTDVGRLFCLDENRTTRTFNTEGLETIALLGIFGGLGQGKTYNRYRQFAEMDVLDLCIWDYAMDWPEMQNKANLLALAYGVGV